MSTSAERDKRISRKKLLQLITAILLTCIIIASVPALAWFNHQRQIAEMQKIKTPDLLYISAACAEDVKFFDISTINIGKEDTDPESQLFPFAVAGEYVTTFTLQFSHTTNIPFTYKIYEGDIIRTNGDGAICKSKEAAQAEVNRRNTEESAGIVFDTDVVEYTVKVAWDKIENLDRDTVYNLRAGDVIFILKGNCLKDGTSADYLNARVEGGRIIANDTYHVDTYQQYSSSYVNKYAEPLYWQQSGINSVSDPSGWGAKPFFKPFILEVSWDREEISNKETDILYFSAYRDS